MAIRSSEFFIYDGKKSSDYGIVNVTMSDGMYEEPFLAERSIKEVATRGNPKRYFQEIEESPLVFDLSFAFQDIWDTDKIREIARWLKQSYYKPLEFSDDDRVFYCVVVNSPQLIHNGLSQGYLTLTMRCNAPWGFSPVYTSEIYDLSNNLANGTVIQFVNNGDLSIKPEIYLEKIGDDNGDISILNQSNAGLELKFTTAKKATGTLTIFNNVVDGETVTIDNQTYEFDNNSTITSGHIVVDVTGDLTPTNAINKLVSAINSNSGSNVTATGDTTTKIITVKAKSSGSAENSYVTTETCLNAAWDKTTLTGGVDGLVDNETVYVNCERKEIVSDISGVYRYDAMSGDFQEMVYGVNNLLVKGNVKLHFRYQFILLQG